MAGIIQLDTLASQVAAQKPRLLKELEQLAGIESPTSDPGGVNEAVNLTQAWCEALGGRTKRHKDRVKSYGDVLEVRFPASARRGSKTRGKPVLLLGHLDTVWERGTLARMPVVHRGDRLFGPGVYDMKAGVVMALTALRVLIESGLLDQPVTLLLVSDEEVGSPFSRPITEKVALGSSAVYVMEPAQGPQGAYKTARKGVGEYRLTVRGVAAHSGVDFGSGHSAVLELARQIERIAAFTDVERGLTLNPGVIGGGTRSNVIAAEAWVDVDVRIAKQADGARIEKKLKGLKPFDRACSLHWSGGINRPPMERTRGTVGLFRRAEAIAKTLGYDLKEAATGGGSDGNFTSSLGLPTLDGMGAVGQGAHASDESVLIDSLVPRTALLAAMLVRNEPQA